MAEHRQGGRDAIGGFIASPDEVLPCDDGIDERVGWELLLQRVHMVNSEPILQRAERRAAHALSEENH